ncbi:PhyH-domain-containing protein [Meredithblackwellia eburnea MCA 4105]
MSPAPPALVTLPVTAPREEMFRIIKRDGGIIISDFLSPEDIKVFNATTGPMFAATKSTSQSEQRLVEMGPDFHASNTTHLRGMLGKCPELMIKVLQHPVWNALMHEVLKTEIKAYVGDHLLTTETTHILSLAVGFHVAPGANDQVLHRDQTIHSVDAKEGSLYTSDLGCLIAGTRSTKKNGATRVVPGSHLWSPNRAPKLEEAVSAEMEAGSAMFWFGSTYHGAGSNTCTPGEPDDVRVLYGVFGCQDFLRPEENQQLVCSEEIARTLPLDVLKVAGWTKGAGGCGFVNAQHPIVGLDFPQAKELMASA